MIHETGSSMLHDASAAVFQHLAGLHRFPRGFAIDVAGNKSDFPASVLHQGGKGRLT